MAIPMGIGALGFNNTIFKRKFRWTLEFQNICGGSRGDIPRNYVKVASRPNIDIDETEIHFLNGVDWLPGKGRWQTMDVTYYDVATADIAPLYNWLASVYNFTDPINLQMGSRRNDYSARGILGLYDGCGALIEQWVLQNMWPKAINWGDLDYSNSDICEISITFRYSNVQYIPVCPSFAINPCCTPCS